MVGTEGECCRDESCYVKIPGGNSGGATPVPIPNTEVKPVIVDGTALERVWESRKLPGYK